MTIVLARKYARIQRNTRYIVLALLVGLFILSTDGTVDVYDFRALTMVAAVILFLAPMNRLPSYKELLDLLEKKAAESNDAIEALAEAKSGT